MRPGARESMFRPVLPTRPPDLLLLLTLCVLPGLPQSLPALPVGVDAPRDAPAPTGPDWPHSTTADSAPPSVPARARPIQDLEVPLVADVPVFRPLRLPVHYRRAVEEATRSEIGRPGPRYWQQRVHYSIRATLNPGSATLVGSERVTYENHSPDTLRSLVVHLYQNVYGRGARRNRRVDLTGGMRLSRVAAEGTNLRALDEGDVGVLQGGASPPPGYVVDGTLARVFLPRPVFPGGTAVLSFDWSFRVPGQQADRMGRIGNELFTVAQWYPQVAVYDDLHGHDVTPYLGDGEFYLEYGSFNVEIEVPGDWLVSATGTLQNAGQVLPAGAVSRLRGAAASDTTIRVVAASDLSGSGREVWRFRAERVRDFAFAASSRYVWDAAGAEVGGDVGRARVDALYDPELRHWREAVRYSSHQLEFFSEYLLPYPYPKMVAAHGPVGGMEYPMLTFVGRSAPGRPLYSVLAHELSHQWFPMMVGSHEARYAWMDEGLASFNDALAIEDFFAGSSPWETDTRRYLAAARSDTEARLMQHTDHVESSFSRRVAAYSKPTVVLRALRAVLGQETFRRAYRTYARSWAYRHPAPWDFFQVVESVADRELDWFWQPWFFGTETLDQAIAAVRVRGDRAELTLENRGGAVMPVELQIRTESGSRRIRWPVTTWAGTRRVTRTVEAGGKVRRVVLDPDRVYPDLDRSNNSWSAGGDGRAGKER